MHKPNSNYKISQYFGIHLGNKKHLELWRISFNLSPPPPKCDSDQLTLLICKTVLPNRSSFKLFLLVVIERKVAGKIKIGQRWSWSCCDEISSDANMMCLRKLTYYVRGSITVRLTSWLFFGFICFAYAVGIRSIFTCLVESKPVKQK